MPALWGGELMQGEGYLCLPFDRDAPEMKPVNRQRNFGGLFRPPGLVRNSAVPRVAACRPANLPDVPPYGD